LEEHIVAEVAWASCCYVDWTGDDAYAHGPGRQLLVETARYWASRIRVESDGTAHIYGVIGPDEYHEPVDDNAFTNVIARWNLRRAAALIEAAVDGTVSGDEVRHWRDLAGALVDGYDPDTGIYEEFAGFYDLEPLIIEEVAPRRPIAADLLLGRQRVQGAQVVKQADVLMLHHLVPDEVEPDSLEPNLRYYEPRTAHGSSLSPAIHAALLARARDYGPALDALRIASRLDLDDLTGTTASGLHMATMGSLWQALVFGFAGMRPQRGRLLIDPRLPPSWGALEVRVQFHGAHVRVRKQRGTLLIRADAPVALTLDGTLYTAGPAPLEFRRRGATWEVVT
jgi:trehalose/maltose hydrolase-like predicted phosphorylase